MMIVHGYVGFSKVMLVHLVIIGIDAVQRISLCPCSVLNFMAGPGKTSVNNIK